MRFDRKKFFDGFRERIDATISQEQVNGIEFILGRMENDPFWKHIPQIAYALATVFHETAGSFQPVEEGYYLGTPRKVKAFQRKLRYYPYYGRGYVQLTWKRNYELAGKKFNIDLVNEPEKALDASVAYKVLTYGMHQGWFTGKKLDDYVKGSKKDYVNARKIINGLDKAGLIAGYASSFEKILTTSAAMPADAPTHKKPAEPKGPAEEQGGPQESAFVTEPPIIDQPAPPTDSGAAPNASPVDGSLSPQVVVKERPSIFTRVMTAVYTAIATALAGVAATCGGNEIATQLATKGGERIVENAERSDLMTLLLILGYVLGIGGIAVGLFWLASWVYQKSSDRANALNREKVIAAASKDLNTVEFKQ